MTNTEKTETLRAHMASLRARIANQKALIFAFIEGDPALAAELRDGGSPWFSHRVYAQGVDYALTYEWMKEWAETH